MSRRERIDELLEHNRKELEALKDEALAEIRAAEREAGAREKRFYEASEELEQTSAKIRRLSAEREGLPDRAYRAGLDEEYELEDQLKERYKNLRPVIEALEDRQGSLKREIAHLLPQPRGHHNDALIAAMASVAGAAARPREDLDHLKAELTKALASAVDPIIREHEERRAEVEQLAHERDWDLHPESMTSRPVVPSS